MRWNNRASPRPHEPIHPSHKKHKSHRALQLYLSLQGVSQLSASYSNPQLLPARNLTVRNLSARRLKPEECYCSGHSCTSTGLATAATVCECGEEGGGGRRWRKEGGRSRRCEKGNFTCFQCSCGLVTKQHIVDSELTHSSGLDGSKALSSLPHSRSSSVFLQRHMSNFVSVSLFQSEKCTQHTRSEPRATRTHVCREEVEDRTHQCSAGVGVFVINLL